jgi:plasmid maintenance system killer protein
LRSDRLAHTAFTLNLSKNELRLEPEYRDAKAASRPLKSPVFRYEFKPPKRFATVTAIAGSYHQSAKEVGFKTSMKVIALNALAVPGLNHFEMNDLLTGKRSKTLTIKTNKDQVFIFDFEKNEFTQTTPVQSTPSRN